MSRRRRDTSLRSGAIVLGLIVAAFAVALGGGVPVLGGDGGRTVRATFTFAPQLNEKTPVRVGGVDVGRVESVERADDGRAALVTMRITDDDVALHEDATAALRYRTLLGGRFEVALHPGSPSAPRLGDAPIPEDRTRPQVELDDALRVYGDDAAVEGQRTMLRELGEALEGDAAGTLVDELGPQLGPLGPALRELRGVRSDDLEGLVASTARAMRALDRSGADVRRLVPDAAATFAATAGARSALGRTLRGAPRALAATRRIAADIDRTLPELDGLLADIRPAAGGLRRAAARARPVAVALDDVLDRAQPLLRRLRPALRSLAAASEPGRALVDGLEPAVARIDDELIPYLEGRESDTGLPVHQLIGPTFATLGSITSEFDRLGYTAHFPIQPAENSLSPLPCTTSLTDPTAAQKARCAGLDELVDAFLTRGGGR